MTKLHKHVKEPEIYYYFNSAGEKLWMYRHKYYDAAGKRREKKKSGFKTDKAAIKALMEVKALTLRGETKLFDCESITIGQWLDQWYESNYTRWKITTQKTYKNAIDKYIKPLLGHYKLQKLKKSTYQSEFINTLIEDGFKPRSIRIWHRVFCIAINAAVEDEILNKNRFYKVKLPKIDELIKDNFLNEQELNIFLNYTQKNEPITNHTAFLLLFYTGMRKGELMGLRWESINFEKNTISINQTRDTYGLRDPKTKNSIRTIPVEPFVMEQLKKYQSWCKRTLLRFGKKLDDKSIVFINEHGEPHHDHFLNNAIVKILKATGLKTITVHGIRHTHATILLNRNENIKAIAERLGNTPTMILYIYGHLTEDTRQGLVTSFSEAVGANIGASK